MTKLAEIIEAASQQQSSSESMLKGVKSDRQQYQERISTITRGIAAQGFLKRPNGQSRNSSPDALEKAISNEFALPTLVGVGMVACK